MDLFLLIHVPKNGKLQVNSMVNTKVRISFNSIFLSHSHKGPAQSLIMTINIFNLPKYILSAADSSLTIVRSYFTVKIFYLRIAKHLMYLQPTGTTFYC